MSPDFEAPRGEARHPGRLEWTLLQPLAWCAVAMVLVSTAAYIRVNLDGGR